jgi:hypothetical protein
MASRWQEAENVREEFGTVEAEINRVRISLNLSCFKEQEKP